MSDEWQVPGELWCFVSVRQWGAATHRHAFYSQAYFCSSSCTCARSHLWSYLQKSATARERNAEKAKKAKGGESQAKKNAAALSIIVSCAAVLMLLSQTHQQFVGTENRTWCLQCGICRSTFVCTSSRAKLQEHVDGKHPKSKFEVWNCKCSCLMTYELTKCLAVC